MKCILTAGWEDGVAALAERLARELSTGKQVLWLTSGGSNIPASVQVMKNISDDLSRKLTIMPADERFGPLGHADSNWTQLMNTGFDAGQAKLLPVLQPKLNFEQTIAAYESMAEQAFSSSDIVIAQLGLGEDGHIAGILPDSPAASEQTALVVGYKTEALDRLTLTFSGLRHINVAYVFAFGAPKKPALESLMSRSLAITKQPAQMLKELPEAYIYNDQVGGDA